MSAIRNAGIHDRLETFEQIEEIILLIRDQKVILDRDLAKIYGVETKNLNRQVKRNKDRFPKEFMFQLSVREKKELVTKWHRFRSMKHTSSLPYAFTEHGVAMLASVLNSDRAVKMSIYIIKVFIKLRELLMTHKEIVLKLNELEKKFGQHDEKIITIFQAIKQMMVQEESPKPKIGFHAD